MPELIPVDHDPFADSLQGDFGAAAQRLQTDEAQRRGSMAQMLQRFTLPGRVAQGVQPETPGMFSEADAFRQNQLEAEAQGWAPAQALSMLSTGTPFAQAGALGSAGGGIKAYHGSPYDFERFDISKIGTGEGAQAYGHGLYFAEHPGTAESYKDALSGRGLGTAESLADNVLNTAGYGREKGIAYLEAQLNREPGGYLIPLPPQSRAEYQKAIELLKSGWERPPGKMYEVAINADPEHFLDWDKPLSEQHRKVREALEPFRRATVEDWSTNPTLGEPTHVGQVIANHSMSGKGAELTAALREAGIPGIKYLDQGSRGSGAGTSNYVVFSHDIIDVLRKYGLGALIAGGGAHFALTPVDHDPFAQ